MSPQFIFERQLAFEARIEALADREPNAHPTERQVRGALDRVIAETMLAALAITPPPTAAQVAQRAALVRRQLEQRVFGADNLTRAASAEGIGSDELDTLFRRKARASLYIDRMMAPMVEPSVDELLRLWRSGATPFTERPFEEATPSIRSWYLGESLRRSLADYTSSSRSRVTTILTGERSR